MDNETIQKLKNHILQIEEIEQTEDDAKIFKKQKYAEAKHDGFDTKILREVIAIRKKDPQQKQEEETLLTTYLQAISQGEIE
jgi:uncharacterized protein (UPF0335 family)